MLGMRLALRGLHGRRSLLLLVLVRAARWGRNPGPPALSYTPPRGSSVESPVLSRSVFQVCRAKAEISTEPPNAGPSQDHQLPGDTGQ